MPGAAALAGMAALRTGCGLVRVLTVRAAIPVVIATCPELVAAALDELKPREIYKLAASCSAIVLGVGLGRSRHATRVLERVLNSEPPLVIDADGLNLLSERIPAPQRERMILTPHPGEIRRLMGLSESMDLGAPPRRRRVAENCARRYRAITLLKGHRTIITDGRQTRINPTGDTSLAKAGSGDVLAGMIGSLLAQGMSPWEATVAGAWIHGKAGELAGSQLGQRCVLARDVIGQIPGAVALYERAAAATQAGRVSSR
jgi:NAD(P)H-hydrate epimerase